MAGVILMGDLDVIAPGAHHVLPRHLRHRDQHGLRPGEAGRRVRASDPTFKVPAFVGISLVRHRFACFYVMSIINLPAMIAAVAIAVGIYAYTQRRVFNTAYGDARFGIWAALVRAGLQQLRGVRFHPQNWRPNVIVFGASDERRPHLIELASTIVQDSGVVSCCYVLEGSVHDLSRKREEMEELNEQRISEQYPNVFYNVLVAPDVYGCIVGAVQTYGIGRMHANTVMLGWLHHHIQRRDQYHQMLVDLVALRRSLILVNHRPERGFGVRRQIHVWWGGIGGNGGLMLLLAFLLKSHQRWAGATITLLTVVGTGAQQHEVEHNAYEVLRAARIHAGVHVINAPGRPIIDIMRENSAHADLAIVGVSRPRAGREHRRLLRSDQPHPRRAAERAARVQRSWLRERAHAPRRRRRAGARTEERSSGRSEAERSGLGPAATHGRGRLGPAIVPLMGEAHDGGEHRLAERRSLELHRAVATRLRARPELLQIARRRVSSWLTQGGRPYAQGWAERLDGPFDELLRWLTEDTEEARAFRQASPFAGVLAPDERWRILKAID